MEEGTKKSVDLNNYLSMLPGSNATNDIPKIDLDPPITSNKKDLKSKNFNEIVSSYHQDALVNARDELNKGKTQTFGADLDHHAFERYYNHPKFSKLGWNPYLDNEARYNKESSFLDEFRRSYGQWKTMVWNAAFDAAGFGDVTDVQAHKNMERNMAIASSTRGGIGGFTNNLFLNSGYTFGIMAEILAEEALIAGATFITGGATSELAILRTAQNANRVRKLFSASEWVAKGNKIVQALDNLKDVGVARSVYQSLVTGGTAAGKYIAKNAAGETYHFLSNFNNLENLSGKAKTAHGFLAFYKDVRNVRLAFGESALEGGTVKSEVTRNLFDQFVRDNGREPEGEEIAKIKALANEAGLATTWTNLPVIYLSNNIVLGNYMKSFSPLRRMLPVAEDKFFKTILTKNGFEAVEKNFTNAAKALIKPRTYGTLALNYTSANLAEGFQESAQEIISGANKDYYTKLYNNKVRGGYYDSIAENIGKQFSPEGLEIFASGFLMGGLVGGATSVWTTAQDKFLKLTDKQYSSKKEASRASATRKAAILTEIYKDPLKYHNTHVNNAVEQSQLQDVMAQAEENNDPKTFHDAKWRSMSNQFWTVFETGTEDTFKARFEELQQLNDEELTQQVSGKDAAEIRSRLAEVSSKMDEFKEEYDFVKKELPNIFKPWDYKQGTPEYDEEAYAYNGFEEAQKDLIFMRDAFKNTLGRMNSILSEAVKDTGIRNITASDVTNLYNLETLVGEMSQLSKEIKALSDDEDMLTPDAKALRTQKENKYEHLNKFYESMFDVIVEHGENQKDTKIAPGESFVFTKENTIKGGTYQKALGAYKNYMKSIAKGPVMDSNLDAAFDKLVDYYLLDSDHTNLSRSVNSLVNPLSFYEYARRMKDTLKVEHESRQQKIEEALLSYENIKNENTLLQELYKRNIFFDADQWEELKTTGKMPKRLFFKSISGKDQLLSTSTEYNEAVDLIKEYMFEKENIEVTDIPLTQNKALDRYDTDIRDRLPGDERTYDDIAEQFGFDPKARKTTLPLREVLTKIADSDFATEQEQALAKRLLRLAKPDETVTFSKELAGPGIYTEGDQTVIDARYSSIEYAKTSQSYPIETSILREEVNRRVLTQFKEDSSFVNTVKDILAQSRGYFNEQAQMGFYDKEFLGLRSPEDFVRETLTNEEFRAFLHEVAYENEGKTAWTEFVDSVVDNLSSSVGEFSNTALNAVINVVTTKIDTAYAQAQAQASGRPTSSAPEVDNLQELSLERLEAEYPQLVDELIDSYQQYNLAFEEIGETDKMMDPDYASKTPEEIKASPQFREFIKMQNPNLIALFAKYKPQAVREIERRPGIRQTITETEQTFLLTAQINKLRELGYTDDEIVEMDVLEGLNIIHQGETKEETAARLEKEKEDLADDRADARQQVYELIDSIENFDDFQAVEAELLARMSNSPQFRSRTGFVAQDISNLLNNKRKELAFKTEFDDIIEGDYIILNYPATATRKETRGVWKVEKKTKNRLSLANDKGGTFNVNRSTFNQDNSQYFIFKYSKEMNEEDLAKETVTPEEQTISNNDVQGIAGISDEDVVNAINKGLKESEEDSLNDFLDSLDDIC